MASLQREKTGKYHIVIFYDGKRYKRSLDTKKESYALARKGEIEETLSLVKRGRLTVPDDVGLIDFVMADGKVSHSPMQVLPPPPAELPKSLTLKQLFDQFFDSI
jgi:hypothetical protein